MFEPFPDELRPADLHAPSPDGDDLSHLECIRTARRCVALELTAVLADPELRVQLPPVRSVFAVRA